MNILRLSTLSLTVAIAVFALGYVSPSFADQPDPTTREHGQHDGEDGTEKFSVEYITTVRGIYGVNTPGGCAGTTDKNLSVNFLTNCVTPDVMAGGTALYASAIAVRDMKLDVLLFFRTEQLEFPNRNPGELYVSDRLPVTIVDGDPREEGSANFHLTVRNPAVVLTKAHQPNKGTTLPSIAVGNIVYTAVTE